MLMRTRLALLVTIGAVLGAAPAAAQEKKDKGAERPAAVTDAAIAKGKEIYGGAGLCYACHGADATGTVGPNLTDAEWIHSKGTYDEIVTQITQGVPKEKSKSGIPMPPKGGSSISDEDVKAVAAYVWSLSHPS